ncbi:hypothetical protein BB558_006774 [Smittium angustum]|uniref:Uncharacterized protein n=1 Tax=Smittium angustum TaxID=133377 RepID=A0A2U1IWS5_SMIAN|nr:hypothetical protein BB558_006774 [Smittium angustum]
MNNTRPHPPTSPNYGAFINELPLRSPLNTNSLNSTQTIWFTDIYPIKNTTIECKSHRNSESFEKNGKETQNEQNKHERFNLKASRTIDLRFKNLISLAFLKASNSFNMLRVLRLGKNNFQNIPTCIFTLQNLEVLELNGNRIDSSPNSLKSHMFSKLENLYSLDLSNNLLTFIPQDFGYLNSKFSRLNLTNNKIRHIPIELLGILHLKFSPYTMFENSENGHENSTTNDITIPRESIPNNINRYQELPYKTFCDDNEKPETRKRYSKLQLNDFREIKRNLSKRQLNHSIHKSRLVKIKSLFCESLQRYLPKSIQSRNGCDSFFNNDFEFDSQEFQEFVRYIFYSKNLNDIVSIYPFCFKYKYKENDGDDIDKDNFRSRNFPTLFDICAQLVINGILYSNQNDGHMHVSYGNRNSQSEVSLLEKNLVMKKKSLIKSKSSENLISFKNLSIEKTSNIFLNKHTEFYKDQQTKHKYKYQTEGVLPIPSGLIIPKPKNVKSELMGTVWKYCYFYTKNIEPEWYVEFLGGNPRYYTDQSYYDSIEALTQLNIHEQSKDTSVINIDNYPLSKNQISETQNLDLESNNESSIQSETLMKDSELCSGNSSPLSNSSREQYSVYCTNSDSREIKLKTDRFSGIITNHVHIEKIVVRSGRLAGVYGKGLWKTFKHQLAATYWPKQVVEEINPKKQQITTYCTICCNLCFYATYHLLLVFDNETNIKISFCSQLCQDVFFSEILCLSTLDISQENTFTD